MNYSKLLINPCHNSFNLFNNSKSRCDVDGYYLSSCHISANKMLSYIKRKNHANNNLIFVDFFTSLNTIDIKSNDNNKCKQEIAKRTVNNVILEKNIISLFLSKKINDAKKLIDKSILDWIGVINNANENFYYALPLPLMGNGYMFREIWKIYFSILKEKIHLINNRKLFISLVIKDSAYFDIDNMNILVDIMNFFNIKICIFSVWRMGIYLLNESKSLNIIAKFINYIKEAFEVVYLNYFHYELPALTKLFPKIHFICGTFEQTKILSPKIKWMNESDTKARFKVKLFLKENGLTIKFDQYQALVRNQIIISSNDLPDILKQNESFYFNYQQFKFLINDNKYEYLLSLQKLTDMKNDKKYKDIISKAVLFSIEDSLKLYEYVDSKISKNKGV